MIKSKVKEIIFFIPALFIFLQGCQPKIVVNDIEKESRPPNYGQLDVYKSAKEVKRPFKTIKIVHGLDDRMGRRQDEELMKKEVLAKARELGADGVIIKKMGTRTLRLKDGEGGRIDHKVKYIDVEAIVYLDH